MGFPPVHLAFQAQRIVLNLGLLAASLNLAPAHAAEVLRVITLGDSITKGERSGVLADETFAARLEADLRQNAIRAEVVNIGIGGERTDQAVKRLDLDVLNKSPHVVTVMYGTNDSYVDAGSPASRISPEEYRRHLRTIVERLQAAGVQVVVMTEPAWGEESRPNGLGEDPNHRLAVYMEVGREVARATDSLLVDHFAHWSAQSKRGTKIQSWTTDGCHPNPRGHEELARRILHVILPTMQRLADQHDAWDERARFQVQLDTLSTGYDGQRCWVHPRAGVLLGGTSADPSSSSIPPVVLTKQHLLLTGSDVFYALNDIRTDDGGKTWSAPREHADSLGRRDKPEGVVVAACDFTPQWHFASKKLLGIGHTVRYQNNKVMENRRRETCYAVYDEETRTWSPWTTLEMPDDPKFANAGAGSVQRVDLPNGEILLPIYFRSLDEKYYRVTVLRCGFDGTKLRFLEQGSELTLQSGRGLYEPSLTFWRGRYFLTMRNDTAGYVSVSDDGLQFGEPRTWIWEDGSEIGNYNTQQHWVTHRDQPYLVYTRRGLQNDHVFRHRAPLLIAEVDPERLVLRRETERVLVPERGARLGNFGVVQVSPSETWVTVAEWMQTWSPDIVIRPDNPYGASNRVYAARIRWRDRNEPSPDEHIIDP
jgi:lysophospholipase L1-like esterase